jgi:RimJ/RimL family protein N-acetyltransferase
MERAAFVTNILLYYRPQLILMAAIFLETARLILRQWEESDYEPYCRLNADAEVMEFLPSVLTPDKSIAQIKRLAEFIDEHGYGFFAVERKDNGQFIGFTGLSQPGFEIDSKPIIEIGWRLSRANWNQALQQKPPKAVLLLGLIHWALKKYIRLHPSTTSGRKR